MKRDPLTHPATILCLILFLPSWPVRAEEPAKKDPSAEPAPGPAPKEKEEASPPKRRVKVRVSPGDEPDAPPKKVKLPGPGEHPAEDILALAGKLHGRPVRFESERARETTIEISDEIANEEVGLDEMTVLLAAHRIYVFPIVDPREGKVLVVSRNPAWKDEPPSFTKVIECSPKDFPHVEEEVNRAVKKKNAALPAGAPRVIAVSSPRTGKIFVRAGSKEDLEEVSRAGIRTSPSQAAAEKKRDEERHRLYTYLGQHRKVEDLEEDLLEKLEVGERNLLRIVITSKGNRMLYRCPAKLGEKVKALLESLDKPPPKEAKKAGKKAPPEGS
jgi:hypothetical protein